MTFFNDAVFAVGIISSVYIIYNIILCILEGIRTFIGSKNLRDYGAWAIVTGEFKTGTQWLLLGYYTSEDLHSCIPIIALESQHKFILSGSTSGIGKSIAMELAKQKINIILISRSEEKLSSVAKEITDKYNVSNGNQIYIKSNSYI